MVSPDTTSRYFNSHPHEEDDKKIATSTNRNTYFNSHPHEEDDVSYHNGVINWEISTHILTKRMTNPAHYRRNIVQNFNSHPHEEDDCNTDQRCSDHILISTHILTKRMTMTIIRNCRGKTHFNSHPHEEDDKLIIPCENID